jgi:hypothetical protein
MEIQSQERYHEQHEISKIMRSIKIESDKCHVLQRHSFDEPFVTMSLRKRSSQSWLKRDVGMTIQISKELEK